MNQPLLQMDLRLVGVAVLLLGVAAAAIWHVGRRLRSELGPRTAAGGTRGALETPSIPPQVSRVLQQRGLATPAQLANMSELERQLLFRSVSWILAGEGELVAPQPSAGRAVAHSDALPDLFCPTCGSRLRGFTGTLPITGECESCRAKVMVRRDGARLLLTVQPGAD